MTFNRTIVTEGRGVRLSRESIVARHIVRDGLYRMEFATGERRPQGPAIRIDLVAEVIDGAGKGLQVGETLSFDFAVYRACGGANEQKVGNYAAALGVSSNQHDYEEWLFRPFLAEVVDRKIVAISDGKSPSVYLPAAAEASRTRAWIPDAGWYFVGTSGGIA